MGLTPEEIRHLSIPRKVRGYDRAETDRILAEIAEGYALVWRERSDLADELTRVRKVLEDGARRQAEQDEEAKRLQERLVSQNVEEARRREELQELQGQIERLEAERAEGRQAEDQLRTELETLGVELEGIHSDRDRLHEVLRRSASEIVELRREAARLEDECARLASDAEAAQSDLRVEAERAGLVLMAVPRAAASSFLEGLRDDADASPPGSAPLRAGEIGNPAEFPEARSFEERDDEEDDRAEAVIAATRNAERLTMPAPETKQNPSPGAAHADEVQRDQAAPSKLADRPAADVGLNAAAEPRAGYPGHEADDREHEGTESHNPESASPDREEDMHNALMRSPWRIRRP